MKTRRWFTRPNPVLSHLRVASAGALILAAVGMTLIAAKTSPPSTAPATRAFVFKKEKGDPDAIRPGANKRAIIGANEYRAVDYTPGIEEFLKRAYPANDVSGEASIAAKNGFAKLSAGPHSSGSWQLIGPSTANFPGVLTFTGHDYTTSGRITALAIAPACTTRSCWLYVGAAGGGIWRTKDGLSNNPRWQFVSGNFGTNAIGSLIVAPNDPSGNTLYAGTGEPNASGDSEAGVGIYKSTDGGEHWAFVQGSGIFFQRSIGQLALDNAGNLLVPIASGVRGISSVSGGVESSGNGAHPLTRRGLYRQTGSTFTRIFTAPAPTRGSTTVQVDPTHAGIIYVNAFQQGIWRSTDNGATFSQIFTPQDPTVAGSATDRSEFWVTTLPSGATRMYVGEGQGGGSGHHANFWRSDNANTTATFAMMGGALVDNYCTGQCWYDNLVVSPAGHPDTVYLGGSYEYPEFGGRSNSRGVLYSTDGGATWTDVSWDATTTPNSPDNCCNPNPIAPNGIHPDQHALVVAPNNPGLFFEGSDGGLMRSSGSFANISSQCTSRGLTGASLTFCQQLLSRVPTQLFSLNAGLSTLQFQSLSVAAPGPNKGKRRGGDNGGQQTKIQGGTQDNGTFQFTGDTNVWPQEIYGDGGQSGFSSTNNALRVNTFTGQFNDVNFHDGDPLKWVIATGPIAASPEASYFYPPVIADPHTANGGTIFQGSFSVWRTQDWAGDQAFLEANCPEFTTSAFDPNCGDFVPIGGAPTTDLTDPVWGTRAGGAVAAISRTASNTGTGWVATGTARVFISDNLDAAAGSVTWNRVDPGTNDPPRFISSIYIDPKNAHHAWISYSGYNANTPSTPGHVFEVTWSGVGTATWVDRSYNLPDFPITGLVRDDVTGDLYAASDFGVMRLANGATTWGIAGSDLPMVEVAGLTIVPAQRQLYAATHGRSAWLLNLSGGSGN